MSAARPRLSRLTLTGDRLSRSGDSCRVDVSETPLKLTPRESDAGLRRYRVDFPACPFSFDVLDGAILVSNDGGACEIKEADCRVDPTGLWGEKDFDKKRGKQMLNTRARVEKTVRADFRALYDKNKKDKPLRKLLVREQAGFSSRREEICRAYLQEADFGYCALRVTEARALTLGTQLAKEFKKTPETGRQRSDDDAPQGKRGAAIPHPIVKPAHPPLRISMPLAGS